MEIQQAIYGMMNNIDDEEERPRESIESMEECRKIVVKNKDEIEKEAGCIVQSNLLERPAVYHRYTIPVLKTGELDLPY